MLVLGLAAAVAAARARYQIEMLGGRGRGVRRRVGPAVRCRVWRRHLFPKIYTRKSIDNVVPSNNPRFSRTNSKCKCSSIEPYLL